MRCDDVRPRSGAGCSAARAGKHPRLASGDERQGARGSCAQANLARRGVAWDVSDVAAITCASRSRHHVVAEAPGRKGHEVRSPRRRASQPAPGVADPEGRVDEVRFYSVSRGTVVTRSGVRRASCRWSAETSVLGERSVHEGGEVTKSRCATRRSGSHALAAAMSGAWSAGSDQSPRRCATPPVGRRRSVASRGSSGFTWNSVGRSLAGAPAHRHGRRVTDRLAGSTGHPRRY